MPRARNAIRRRMPKQERSRRLVEAVIEAARRVLADGGPDALTTVNVATRAGVSVGSLYQYFAGRDALLFAVYEEELRGFRRQLAAWRSRSHELSTPDRIAEWLDLLLAHYRRLAALEPAFFLRNREQIEAGLRPRRAREERPLLARTRDDLLRARAMLRAGRTERAAAASFLVAHGIPALLDAALEHQPAILGSPEFAEELLDLVRGYLLPERA
jgi:AcrR family transcriptional regulator